MKVVYLVFLLFAYNYCISQEVVFRASVDRGYSLMTPSVGSPLATAFWGNFGRNNSDYFKVYRTDETDAKLNIVNTALDAKVKELQVQFDREITTLDSTFTKALIDNVDIIKSQIKVAAIDELKTFIEATIKSEIDKLRSDMQQQIDVLKNRRRN